MIRRITILCASLILAGGLGAVPAAAEPRSPAYAAQRAVVLHYLADLRDDRYSDAYRLLESAGKAYFREPDNFRSVYRADAYRILAFAPLRARGDDRRGRVFFMRETARFRDHAHDVDLRVTATVPIGAVFDRGGWKVKDPGHPWRAFASRASGAASGLRVTVKKVSFFARRIETVVTIANLGSGFVTVLAYGKSILHDAAGVPYRVIETRDWSVTDKTLFEGLRLAPDAQYTGFLNFACQRLDDAQRSFVLSIRPMLADGSNTPFGIDVANIAPNPGAERHE